MLPCQAAEWSVEPRLELKAGYNDNIRLTTRDHDSVWETALTPRVKFGTAEENWGVHGNASASIRRFFGGDGREDNDILDREDYFFNVDAYRRGERSEFTGLIDLARQSTIDAELEEGDAVDNTATLIRKTISPGWSYNLTELMRFNAGYSFTAVDFSDEKDSGSNRNNIEYDYQVFSGSLTRQFTPKVQATLATSYSMYQPETNFDSDTLSVQVGIRRDFTETLTTDWLAGMRRTESDTGKLVPEGFCAPPGGSFPDCTVGIPVVTGSKVRKNSDTDTGTVFSASITKLLESGQLSLSASRMSTPSSDGELLDTTRFIFKGEHRFTETLRTTLRAEYSNIEVISRASLNDRGDRDIYRVIPRIIWRFQREWEIAGQYEYAKKDEDDESGNATRNAVYLTLSYRPDKLFISR
jgi:hypothetical protein